MRGELSLWQQVEDGSYVQAESMHPAATGERYKTLKNIPHATLAVLYSLKSCNDTQQIIVCCTEEIERLELLSESVENSNAITAEDRSWQQIIIKETIAVLQEIMQEISANKPYNCDDKMRSLYVTLQDAIDYNGRTATELQLNSLNTIMFNWLDSYQLQMQDIHYLLVCTHGPASGLIEATYARSLYEACNLPPEEYVHVPSMLLSQMLTIKPEQLITEYLLPEMTNSYTAKMVFGKANAMQRDILSAYAPSVLTHMQLGPSL